MKKNEMQFYQLVHDFLNDYLITRRCFSMKTVRAYRQALKLLRIYLKEEKGISFDKVNFSCFNRDNIYDFLMWLKNERSCSIQTLNLRLSAIKSFLKFCGEEEIELMKVYMEISGIHAFRGTKKVGVEYLTQPQLKHLFSIPDTTTRKGRRNRFFIIFAYETGARLQELLDMRLDSIIRSDTSVRVRIHGKGNKIRYVPLLAPVEEHLDAYLSEFHPNNVKDDYLFYTIHDSMHTQMKPGTVDYFLKQYGGLANTMDATFPKGLHEHMLRHSIAMAMYKKGIPISYIRDFLGHSSIETTTVYSYADGETITKALESIEHDDSASGDKKPVKGWKGKEQFLLEFCGLE